MELSPNTKKGMYYIIISIVLYFMGFIFNLFFFTRGILGIVVLVLFLIGLAKVSFNSKRENQLDSSASSTKNIDSYQKLLNVGVFIFFLVGIPIILSRILPSNPEYYLGPYLGLASEQVSNKVEFMNLLNFVILPFSWFFLLVWWFKKKLR